MNSVACPNCQKRLKLSNEQLKRKLRCSSCATRFIVGGQSGTLADGTTEYLAIEVFDDESPAVFEPAPAKSKPRPEPEPAPPDEAEVPSGPVYSDNILPDEFGLIDDSPPPPRLTPVEAPRPKPKPAPVPAARAKPVTPPRPPQQLPKAKPIVVPKPTPTPVAPPAAPRPDVFDLGADTEKVDIHLEMRTPEAAAPPRRAPLPTPVPAPPTVPKPAPRPVAKASPPVPQPVVDEVEVIEEEFEIVATQPPPPVRTTKAGVPIVEAASEEEIAQWEARQAALRKQRPQRGR